MSDLGTPPAVVPTGPGTIPAPAAPQIPSLDDLEKLYVRQGAKAQTPAPSLDDLEKQYAPAGGSGNINLGADEPQKNTPSVSPTGTDQGTGIMDQLKGIRDDFKSPEGVAKLGKGLYHGIVDPVATTLTELEPGGNAAQAEYDKAHPDQPWFVPRVAHDAVGRIAAPLTVAATVAPIGELAGAGAKAAMEKLAPSAAERIAELMGTESTAGAAARVAAAAGKSAAHGAAIGAASDLRHPLTGAALGGAAGAVIAPVAMGAGKLIGDVGHANVDLENELELRRQDAVRQGTNHYPEDNPSRLLPAESGQAPPPPQPRVKVTPRGSAPAAPEGPDFEVEQNPAPPAAPPAPAAQPETKLSGAETIPPVKLLPPGRPGTPEGSVGTPPVELPHDDALSYMDDRIKALLSQRDEAQRAANVHPLTGLPNKAAWQRALPNAEAHPRMSILRADINGMKNAQDAVGSHAEGDKIIISGAQAMQHAAAQIPGARVFHPSGDEFSAIVPTEHAQAFQQAAEQAYGVKEHGQGARTSLSVGIGKTDAEADAAAYQRKTIQKAEQGIGGRKAALETAALPPSAAPEAAKGAEGTPGAPAVQTRVNWDPAAWRARYGAQLAELTGEQLRDALGHLEENRKKAERGSPAEELIHRDILNVSAELRGRERATVTRREGSPDTPYEQSLLKMDRGKLEAELERHETELDAGLNNEDAHTARRVVEIARKRLAEMDAERQALPAGSSAPTLDDLEKQFAPAKPINGPPAEGGKSTNETELEPRAELEREHAGLLKDLRQPKLSRLERRAIIRHIDYVRGQLRAHGMELEPLKHEQPKGLPGTKKGPPALPSDIGKKPKLSEDNLEQSARYEDGERFRPYHTVSTSGLVTELADLQDRIAGRQMDTLLRSAETDDGSRIAVTSKSRGGRPSVQSQARTNIAAWENRIHQITEHLKQARGMSQEEIDELNFQEHIDRRIADDRAKHGGDDAIPFEVGPVYHGTHGIFPAEELKIARKDLGIHFGTKEQAAERLAAHRRGGIKGWSSGPRTIQAILGIENPLRVRDVGNWKNLPQVLQGVSEALKLPDIPGVETMGQLRKFLESRGYDGVVYANVHEVPGLSEALQAQQFAHGHWSEAVQHGRPNVDELHAKYIAARDRVVEINKAKKEDSYIAFRPRQVRNAVGEQGVKYGGKEHVTTAAVRVLGNLYTGPTHWQAIEKAAEALGKKAYDLYVDIEEPDQGFMTSRGRFVSRAKADELALEAGQYSDEARYPGAGRAIAEDFNGLAERGAHYRAELTARAKQLEPAVAEHLGRTFGSPEDGLAMADLVATKAGDYADTTYTKPSRGNLKSSARRENVAKATAAMNAIHSSVSVAGKRVTNPLDVARLMRPFRDPSAEHLHFLFLDPTGRILLHQHFTSGAINYVNLTAQMAAQLAEIAKRIDAVSITPVHNHPSGNPTPSGTYPDHGGDISFHAELSRELERHGIELNDHVILNHTKYGVITMMRDAIDAPEYPVPMVREIPDAAQSNDWTAPQDMRTSNADQVAAIMGSHVSDANGFHALYLDVQNGALAATPHTPDAIEHLAEWLPRQLQMHGAASVVFVTRSLDAYQALGRQLRQEHIRESELPSGKEGGARLGDVLDVIRLSEDPSVNHVASSMTDRGFLPHFESPKMKDAIQVQERPQLGMFGDEPAPEPSKKDQLGMFGELEGTKLAQDEATKLRNKDQKISAQELEQRRDELGAPKPAEPVKAEPGQGALFEKGPGFGRVATLEGAADSIFEEESDDEELSRCTTTARMIAQEFGGSVVGYLSDDNPTASMGEREGGHDFALIDGRYIVDPWAKHVDGSVERATLDLENPADKATARKLYGDPSKWEIVEKHSAIEKAADSAPAEPTTAAETPTERVTDIGPVLERRAGFGASFNRAFNPLAEGDQAAHAGRIIRSKTGEMARQRAQIQDMLRPIEAMFGKMPEQDRYDFIDRMEEGQPQPTRELEQIAKVFRKALDSAREAVQDLGTGKLRGFIEDYFPHIWEDPDKAAAFFGKRPLEGSKSFLKQRKIPTIKEGLKAGLKPVSSNPATLVTLKLFEMHKYIMATRIIQEHMKQGLAKWVSTRRKPPEDWTLIKDPAAVKYGPPTVTVTHTEAFDAHLRDQLASVIDALRIRHARTVKDPDGSRVPWGWAEMGPARRMWTKMGGGPDVIIHELGHMIDFKHELWDRLVEPVTKRTTKGGKKVSADSPAVKAHRKEMISQLRALADARYKGDPGPTFQKYVRNRREQMANAVHALVFAPELGERLAPDIMAKLRAFFAADPVLKPLLSLERSVQLGTKAEPVEYDTGGVVIMAKLYAPDAVARVLNNYLSPGLGGSPYYRLYMGIGNVLNAAQLSLSAFHLAFTSLDASISKFALGLEQIATGQPFRALQSFATVPVAPITNVMRGDRVLRAYLKPGSQGARFAEIADQVASAGGRAKMEDWYRVKQWQKMKDNMVEAVRGQGFGHRTGSAGAAVLRALPATMEVMAKPILEYIVPRQKLGVFADLVEHELRVLRKGGKDLTEDEVRSVMQRAWNSVDNRMGQMVYDNLFWNKVGKDLAHGGMRSVGWNVGTFRELGGAVGDTKKALERVIPDRDEQGQRRLPPPGAPGERAFTHRMAYALALPMVMGAIGATWTYLATGKPPKELLDYYYPKTGGKTAEGDDARVSLPSYMKDIFSFARHPVDTVLHKMMPLLSLIASMLENQDYYGNEIVDPNSPKGKQVEQALAGVGKQFLPFSVQGALEQKSLGASRKVETLPLVGIMPAPKEVTRTAAQQRAFEDAQLRRKGIQTPDQADASQKRYQLEERVRAGEDIRGELGDMVRDGELSPADVNRILKSGRTSAEIRRFMSLSLDQAQAAFDLATPAERRVLGPILARKRASLGQRHGLKAGQ